MPLWLSSVNLYPLLRVRLQWTPDYNKKTNDGIETLLIDNNVWKVRNKYQSCLLVITGTSVIERTWFCDVIMVAESSTDRHRNLTVVSSHEGSFLDGCTCLSNEMEILQSQVHLAYDDANYWCKKGQIIKVKPCPVDTWSRFILRTRQQDLTTVT